MRKRAASGVFLFGVMVVFASLLSSVGRASEVDLQTGPSAAILRAVKHDKTRTDHEKLFVYRCEIMDEVLGYEENPTGQATKHSCDHTEVGIALYAGNDLGNHTPEKVAQYLMDELKKHRVNSTVFIKHKHPYGTSMAFYINGSSWLRNPVGPMRGIELIEALAAETKLILLKYGRLKEWPQAAAHSQ